jgi:unsaturated chondroitin disaccharide hydrolase
MKSKLLGTNVVIVFAIVAFTLFKSCQKPLSEEKPVVSVWNYDHMLAVRNNLDKGKKDYRIPFNRLIMEAEILLRETPTSVVDKPDHRIAKSGDKHDFISVSKYCWPNPNTADGMPWVYIDGIINEENFSKDDAVRQDKMCNNVTKLSHAYFFSRDNRFAEKAVELARVWFIDPSTRMNPHLTFAQVIPGVNNDMGHPPGIIFGRIYINLLSGLSLVKNSPAYTREFDEGMKKWFSEYFIWLTTSEAGQIANSKPNNHSIAYDQQRLAIALFTDDNATAKEIVDNFFLQRVAAQVEPDGRMPHELSRNRALGYTAYNTMHLLEMCEMASKIHPTLYNEKTDDGRSIGVAIDFLASFLGTTEEEFYPYQQIDDWEKSMNEVCWIVKWAHKYDHSKNYNLMFNKHITDDTSHINYLLY